MCTLNVGSGSPIYVETQSFVKFWERNPPNLSFLKIFDFFWWNVHVVYLSVCITGELLVNNMIRVSKQLSPFTFLMSWINFGKILATKVVTIIYVHNNISVVIRFSRVSQKNCIIFFLFISQICYNKSLKYQPLPYFNYLSEWFNLWTENWWTSATVYGTRFKISMSFWRR